MSFKHRTTPANLVMLYFEEPDTSAHSYGPESIEVIGFIQRMDNITSYIRQKLANMNLLTNTNVILLSDHGMRTVTPQKIVNLTQYVDKSFFKIVDTSPVLQMYPNRGKENVVYNALNAASQNAKFSVYRRNEIPERWHYRQSSRTPPILAVADGGYAFQDLIEWYQNEILKKNNVPMTSRTTLGLHGYDNRDSCMHPFFIASGPLIKTGLSIQPFDTVDYYSLFSTILGITPEPNNGTLANVRVMLKNSHSV
ncbi:Ectonucleotide pyrophosphatase/phosphodiesterase family member 5 [Blattella germanica]|nr:Ectonucleotide pyrophosphatase/phosphodiesterase family member 5 [Blattella germanica]